LYIESIYEFVCFWLQITDLGRAFSHIMQ